MHAGAVKEARVSFAAFFSSEIVLYKTYKKSNEKLCKSDVEKAPGGSTLVQKETVFIAVFFLCLKATIDVVFHLFRMFT